MSDLIGNLAGSLGLETEQAEGAAGTVLGIIKQNGPEGALDNVVAETPEAEGWMQKAAPALENASGGGGGGGFGGLAGSLFGGGGGGGLGGLVQGAAALQTVTGALEKLGIPSGVAVQAIPHVISFLKSKLGDHGFAALLSKIPFLKELAGSDSEGEGDGGGLMGSLGKLF